MGLVRFLNSLFDNGRVSVGDPRAAIDAEFPAADELLAAIEHDARRELSGSPPPLSLEAARWGAVMLYRAAQLLMYRDLGPDAVAAGLRPPCPAGDESSTHYSVDLTFRFLPDLVRMARTCSHDDPLVVEMMSWASTYPLSSVGLDGVGEIDVEPIAKHPGLLAIYVDRVIAAQDVSRLADERVRAAIAAALGMHGHLAPKLSVAIERQSVTKVSE